MRFSLRALLVVTAIVAAFLAGYATCYRSAKQELDWALQLRVEASEEHSKLWADNVGLRSEVDELKEENKLWRFWYEEAKKRAETGHSAGSN